MIYFHNQYKYGTKTRFPFLIITDETYKLATEWSAYLIKKVFVTYSTHKIKSVICGLIL